MEAPTSKARVSVRPPSSLPLRILFCVLEPGVDLLNGLVEFMNSASLPMAFTVSSYGVVTCGRVRKPLEPRPETPEAILDEFHQRLGIQQECRTYDAPQRLEHVVGESQWKAWEAERAHPSQEQNRLAFTLEGANAFQPFVIEAADWCTAHGSRYQQPVVVSYIQGGRRRSLGDRFFLFASGHLRPERRSISEEGTHTRGSKAAAAEEPGETQPDRMPSSAETTTTAAAAAAAAAACSAPNDGPVVDELEAHAVQVGLLDHGTQVAVPGIRVAFGMAVPDDQSNSRMYVSRVRSGSELMTAVRKILTGRQLDAAVVLGCSGHLRGIRFQRYAYHANNETAAKAASAEEELFAAGEAFLIESLQGCYDSQRDGPAMTAALNWVLSILDDRPWRDTIDGKSDAQVPLLRSYGGLVKQAICDGDVELVIAQVISTA